MILINTDHLSVLVDGRHSLHGKLASRLDRARDVFAIPVVSVEEQLRAWLAQIRRLRDAHRQIPAYRRLLQLLDFLGEWEIADWDSGAADQFVRLRATRVRIGTQDLKIASIALSQEALLLSANLRDFQRVPGLHTEDWLH